MSEATEITPERLAAVEEEVARLRADKQRRDEELQHLGSPPPLPQSRGSGWKREFASLQERARQVRCDAHEEAGQLYEKQLERTRPAREKLEAQLAELATREREENERHARQAAAISEKRTGLRAKLDELQVPRVTAEELLATPERQALLHAVNDQAVGVLLPAHVDRGELERSVAARDRARVGVDG
jgi:hypothetical protein